MSLLQRLARVGQHGLAHGREQAVMKVRPLVGNAPQSVSEKPSVASHELWGSNRLIHVERLFRRLVFRIGDVVQLEVGVRRNAEDGRILVRRGEPWLRQ